jgi:hypothetical protein
VGPFGFTFAGPASAGMGPIQWNTDTHLGSPPIAEPPCSSGRRSR